MTGATKETTGRRRRRNSGSSDGVVPSATTLTAIRRHSRRLDLQCVVRMPSKWWRLSLLVMVLTVLQMSHVVDASTWTSSSSVLRRDPQSYLDRPVNPEEAEQKIERMLATSTGVPPAGANNYDAEEGNYQTSQLSDDCTACCPDARNSKLACCQSPKDNLGSTPFGECSGLPCCDYRGRYAPFDLAWYPCVTFSKCQAQNQRFCNSQMRRSFINGSEFDCKEDCCRNSNPTTGVWTNVNNAKPGQSNASFMINFEPDDYLDNFGSGSMRNFSLQQIMIASPKDFSFSPSIEKCLFEVRSTTETKPINCWSGLYKNRSYLVVDVSGSRTGEAFNVYFDQVWTPTAIPTPAGTGVFSSNINLLPMHFMFNDHEHGFAYSTFSIEPTLEPAALYSAALLPENTFPGMKGMANLTFLAEARIPAGGIVTLRFNKDWSFPNTTAAWSFIRVDNGMATQNASTSSNKTTNSSASIVPSFSVLHPTYESASSTWTIVMEEQVLDHGWITFSIPEIQAPAPKYSGFNVVELKISDPSDHLIMQGNASTLSIDFVDESVTSPYNYISLAIFIGALIFCIMVIRSHGLCFCLGSLWTDLTAICTMLGLLTAIFGNIYWLVHRSSTYFYVTRVQMCFTFTMLTAVCFHWGTVLSLRLRKLPKMTTVLFFALINACFYAFQVVVLLRNKDFIESVYAAELAPYSTENQLKCHKDDADSSDSSMSSNVFSDIQGYLWRCYGDGKHEFFLISTTLTLALFLLLSVIVLGMGVMVLQKGKKLLETDANMTTSMVAGDAKELKQVQQMVLKKALRLYYALIGVVTVVYVMSWVVQIPWRFSFSYPWFYFFSVWLPITIPPCCLIFLQWNATTKSLRKKEDGIEIDYTLAFEDEMSQFFDEVRTPSFAYSSVNTPVGFRGDGDFEDGDEDDDEIVQTSMSLSGLSGGRRYPATSTGSFSYTNSGNDWIGLSMALDMNAMFEHGCFIVILRLEHDEDRQYTQWRRVCNTDTVAATSMSPVSNSQEGEEERMYHYSFMAVPRVQMSDDVVQLRMIVYANEEDTLEGRRTSMQEELASFHEQVEDSLLMLSSSHRALPFDLHSGLDSRVAAAKGGSTMNPSDLAELTESSRIIEDLFETESMDSDTSSEASSSENGARFTVVAEFSVTSQELVAIGTRNEHVVVEGSQRLKSQRPPRLSINPVLSRNLNVYLSRPTLPNLQNQTFTTQMNTIANATATGGVAGLFPMHSITSQYHIREQALVVVEDLSESRFGNDIPRQMLEILLRIRGKQFLRAQNDLKRLDAFDEQRMKGTTSGMYANLIEQIQDDGDLNRCREWMIQRCEVYQDYIALLKQLRRIYVIRERERVYFKPSTEKKNPMLRFLPINLHLQEMYVSKSENLTRLRQSELIDEQPEEAAKVYDIVTVGAFASHVHKFKYGGMASLVNQRKKQCSHKRDITAPHQRPLWTEEERKFEDLQWSLMQRMDVCFCQSLATLVTSFCRKIDMALQHSEDLIGRTMLHQMERLGFVFQVESLLSTHGNEVGMLEDMACAVDQLKHVQFLLVEEKDESEEVGLSIPELEEKLPSQSTTSVDAPTAVTASGSSAGALGTSQVAGVLQVEVFSSLEQALPKDMQIQLDKPRSSSNASNGSLRRSAGFFGLRRKNSKVPSKDKSAVGIGGQFVPDDVFDATHVVVRVKVRCNKRIPLSSKLAQGTPVRVVPMLFTQGINEKQTIANRAGSSMTHLQDEINERNLRILKDYVEHYYDFVASPAYLQQVPRFYDVRSEMAPMLRELENLVQDSKVARRRKRPEILQLSADLCRAMQGGRVTVCKSAKDRTGMAVTLEQGRILEKKHNLTESKSKALVAVMRAEGVRIENAYKNTGRRMFAFNALQRSLIPEEYRCPPQCGGRNVS